MFRMPPLHDNPSEQPLTFPALDGIAFAASRGRLGSEAPKHVVTELGPLVEWMHLSAAGLLPMPAVSPWLKLATLEPLCLAATNGTNYCASQKGERFGVFKYGTSAAAEQERWRSFQLASHKAALAAGFPSQIASQLIGALGEIHDNVLEHSEAAGTEIVTFRANPALFEFAVADHGVGVLASLKTNPEHGHLRDHGEALQHALTDGVSRFGQTSNRGTGFSQLFKGLATLNGSLRFRSGDHALSIDGKSPTLMNAVTAMKPAVSGFVVCVACRNAPAS
jgi:anti-sigma regulatory factor (Ser/Thr protein kinase)